MLLSKLHKKLAMKALDKDNPHAERIAKSIGWSENGEFKSFYDTYMEMYGENKVEKKD